MKAPGTDRRPILRVGEVVDEVGEMVAEHGLRRVLVVTDPGVSAAGHATRVSESLGRAGVTAVRFDGVVSNPSTKVVRACARAAAGCDGLVAVGGGSSMDCAKGAAFLLAGAARIEDVVGYGKAPAPLLPMFMVPTTAGTGSDAQSFALISDPVTHRKMACGDPSAMATAVFLDPSLTATTPRDVTVQAGLDALVHAVETWVTAAKTDDSAKWSMVAFRLLSGAFHRVLDHPDDESARCDMLLGAHWAGRAIEGSMLGAAHAMANPLTMHLGVPHGVAVGTVLPAVVAFNQQAVSYADLHPDLPGFLVDTLDRCGLPRSLADYGVTSALIPVLAEEAARQWTGSFNPRPADQAAYEGLYATAMAR